MLASKAPLRTSYSSKGTTSKGGVQRRQSPTSGGKSIAAVAALSHSVGGSDSGDDSRDEEEYADQRGCLELSAAKRRAGKGGRRAAGRRSSHVSLGEISNGSGSISSSNAGGLDDGAEAKPDFPRGGINGPRPVFCVCRQSNLSDEGMLKCTDCKGKRVQDITAGI
ncbi:hypothetical protein LPJ75_002408 [Coemansia sp. RSA 2598]|nr:hypothetical protein LPJ75_002408 [Coemansia sp. RSA 2598]